MVQASKMGNLPLGPKHFRKRSQVEDISAGAWQQELEAEVSTMQVSFGTSKGNMQARDLLRQLANVFSVQSSANRPD